MKLLPYLYAFAIIIVLLAYYLTKINLIWSIGYLVMLLISTLTPKRLKYDVVLALIFMGLATFAVYSGLTSFAYIATSLLIIVSGLPGIILYAVAVSFFHSYSLIAAITLIPTSILTLIIIIHIIKFILDRLLFVAFFMPFVDILPFLIDAALVLALTYLTFQNSPVLYSTIQSGVNSLIHII